MKEEHIINLDNIACFLYGDRHSENWLIQPVDDHDLEGMDNEVSVITELTGNTDFCLITFKVRNWNTDLSPWKAPAVFGNADFGDGARTTLDFLTRELLPKLSEGMAPDTRKMYLGGYSLAGLFSLWTSYQTDIFTGVAGVSPSVWFPGWPDYAKGRKCLSPKLYLSLGNKEYRTRNPIMGKVGEAIAQQYELGCRDGSKAVLEWNEGNHFKEPDVRMAKGFAWLLR